MKKRIVALCVLILITTCSLFVGCAKKEQEQEYGTVDMTQNIVVRYPDRYNSEDYGFDYRTLNMKEAYCEDNLVSGTVTIKDIQSLNNTEINYIDNYDPTTVENSIVVTKWMYYYSLLVAENNTIININDLEYILRIIRGKDCIERVNLYPSSYIITEDCGLTWETYYRIIHGICPPDMLPFLEGFQQKKFYNNTIVFIAEFFPLINYIPDELSDEFKKVITSDPICVKYCGELTTAALYRYQVLKMTDSKPMGKLYVTDPNDPNNILTLNVVGFIETEADKLLSKGVSTDKESEEYQTVVNQLENPVFYSTCGNFLKK